MRFLLQLHPRQGRSVTVDRNSKDFTSEKPRINQTSLDAKTGVTREKLTPDLHIFPQVNDSGVNTFHEKVTPQWFSRENV